MQNTVLQFFPQAKLPNQQGQGAVPTSCPSSWDICVDQEKTVGIQEGIRTKADSRSRVSGLGC